MKINKVIVLINSKANSSHLDKKVFDESRVHIEKFMPCEFVYTTSIEDYKEKLAKYSEDSGNLIVPAGGDGTINIALNNIARDAVVGLIPSGTANVIAKEFGLPVKLKDCFKLLLTGAVKDVDLGICNGQRFAFVCGIGFDAETAASVSHKLKSYLGQGAYVFSAIKTMLFYKPALLTITDDKGIVHKGYFAIFANMRRYGGGLSFAPEARYDDGILNLVLLKKYGFLPLLKLIKYAFGLGSFPEALAGKVNAKSFHVDASKPSYYELDGEVFGPADKFDMSVDAGGQRIIIP